MLGLGATCGAVLSAASKIFYVYEDPRIAEVEGLTGKRAEVLELALRISALDAGDTLGVVPAKNELLNHLGDPLDTESAVDSGVFAFVLLGEALKMLFKQNLEVIDAAWPVHPSGDRRDRKG